MNLRYLTSGLLMTAMVLIALVPIRSGHATVVEFQTSLGNFEVNLADTSTPLTVANFLEYVNNGRYTNSIIHRSVSGFVAQGGGFTFDLALPLQSVPTFAAVNNEPEFSSSRGTIAMAKLGGDPNSATSQWFFNLSDNSGLLDGQNGGFTVFGEVVGNGMDVVDAIAALPTFNYGSPLNELPLRDFTSADYNNNEAVDDTNLVIITAVVVTDSTVDTSAGLNLVPNTVTTPGLNLIKSGALSTDADSSGDVTEGDTLTYTFTATNTGPLMLTNVMIADPLPGLSTLSCLPNQPATLASNGDTLVCTATYVVTAADANAGSIINNATASSDQTPNAPATDTVPVFTPAPPVTPPVVLPGNTGGGGGGGLGFVWIVSLLFAYGIRRQKRGGL